MPISSQASKDEGSETIPQGSTPQERRKRLAPKWGEDIVRSVRKRAAVQEVFNAGYGVIDNGCWQWNRGKSHGYGQLRVHAVYGDKPLYAHRVSYVLYRGIIADGLSVCHICDNPLCVNPDHLFLGTQRDNLADMVAKGRHAKGEKNGQSKLSDLAVEQIRQLVHTGYKQYTVAKIFGLSQAQISRIVRGVRRVSANGKIRKQHGNFKHGRYTSSDEHK